MHEKYMANPRNIIYLGYIIQVSNIFSEKISHVKIYLFI